MSELKTNKVSPATGTALAVGDSGDTITLPSGATLDISASTLTPPATMPASSGVNFTALNATNLGSGTVPTARLGSGTASSSTVLYGDNTWKAEPGGGLANASMWVLTTSLTSITDVDITSNLAVYSGDGYGSLGSAMTESSGIFTFPSTGYWQITFRTMIHKGLSDTYSSSAAIYTTINDSSYGLATKGRAGNWGSGGVQYAAPASSFLFDVTDVANCKVKFHIEDANTSDTFVGSTTYIATGFEFMRLGDT